VGGDGRIVEFKVMIRPLKAINLIHQKMRPRSRPTNNLALPHAIFLLALLLLALRCRRSPIGPPAARAEIDALLARLEACEFNRNGAWYTAAEPVASAEEAQVPGRPERVQTTEQFISSPHPAAVSAASLPGALRARRRSRARFG